MVFVWSVCGKDGVMHFVCLFFSLAWMPWIIFTEALGTEYYGTFAMEFIVLSVGQFDGFSKTLDSNVFYKAN